MKTIDQKLVDKALEFATKAHEGDKRWSGTDYINHPITVASKFHESAHLLKICALLHDVVEDTYVTLENIGKEFGYSIEGVVEILTHRKDKGESYLAYLKRVKIDHIAVRIKLADLEHNLSDLGDGNLRDKYIMAQAYLLDNEEY